MVVTDIFDIVKTFCLEITRKQLTANQKIRIKAAELSGRHWTHSSPTTLVDCASVIENYIVNGKDDGLVP